MSRTVDYALYRYDELLMVGSCQEIANYLGVQVNTVYCQIHIHKGKPNDKGYAFVKLEEDEEEE